MSYVETPSIHSPRLPWRPLVLPCLVAGLVLVSLGFALGWGYASILQHRETPVANRVIHRHLPQPEDLELSPALVHAVEVE